jgi:transcription antitermination factor NusA-like protein
MSGYILTNKLKPLEGKYLMLYKVNKSDELDALVFTENNEIKIDKVERVEQNSNITIFFVKAKNKAELIGKNGKNIKQMRKEYGNIVVKIML